MKKILSVALSTAMAFSMFASVAFGDTATLSAQDKFDALKTKGIFSGYPDGTAGLENNMTRAEFAKVITKVMGLKEVTGVVSYKDAGYNHPKNWAAPYIEAVTAAGVMQGQDLTKQLFNQKANVTVQELAEVLVKAMKIEIPTTTDNTATEWAKGSVQAAINAGLLSKDLNFQANATRSLLVEAAFAAEAALNVPPVVNATKVASVSANNLKEITVVFDGKVDEDSAETISNYKINKVLSDAELQADGKTVILTLEKEFRSENNNLDNQKETKFAVDGVKNADKSKTISEELKFTPVDVTTPAVKEVVGLGTKAYKVVFSEPVDRADVVKTSNYKINGKSISGYVDYVNTTTVVVNTELAIGSHKLTVTDVQDFSGLKVVPLETEFAVVEDKDAPTVVTATGGDFTKVTIKFNEPVKSISKVYNGSSSKTGTYTVAKGSDEVVVTFSRANALSLGENNIVIEGVTDYSNNSANREVKATPTPDAVRPELKSASEEANATGNSVITLAFSEDLSSDAGLRTNYTVRDKDGKVVVGKGLDSNGHPIVTGVVDGKKVKLTLAGRLAAANYTIEVSGVQDNAFVKNTILPASTGLTVSHNSTFEAKKFWVETQSGSNAKKDVYYYVTFSKAVATTGTGSALVAAKYNYSTPTDATYKALPTDTTVELVTPETVKITVPYTDKYTTYNQADKLRISLIADQDGNYANEDSAYISVINRTTDQIGATEVKAVAKDKVEVKFSGKLVTVDAREFGILSSVSAEVYGVTLEGYKYDGTDTIANFKVSKDLNSGNGTSTIDAKFVSRTAGTDDIATTVNTQDGFGFKVNTIADVTDAIKPAVKVVADKNFTVASVTGAVYAATLTFTEDVVVAPGSSIFKVTVNGADATAVSYTTAGSNQVIVRFTSPIAITSGSYVGIQLLSSNEDAKVIKDAEGNAVDGFTVYEVQ